MIISALFLVASVVSPVPAPQGQMTVAEEPATTTVCPVCGKTIQPGMGTKISIRGREYTVDETTCSDQLMADPDKYLEPDGTPKNARK
jgi:hypothetical protein